MFQSMFTTLQVQRARARACVHVRVGVVKCPGSGMGVGAHGGDLYLLGSTPLHITTNHPPPSARVHMDDTEPGEAWATGVLEEMRLEATRFKADLKYASKETVEHAWDAFQERATALIHTRLAAAEGTLDKTPGAVDNFFGSASFVCEVLKADCPEAGVLQAFIDMAWKKCALEAEAATAGAKDVVSADATATAVSEACFVQRDGK